MNADGDRMVPLYRIIEDESQQVVLTALDLEGFFIQPIGERGNVRVLGVPTRLVPKLTRLHDIELQVLDLRGEVIGAYYVGEVEILNRQAAQLTGWADLDMSFLGYSCPFPHAGEIWRLWAYGRPRVRGEWRLLPPDWHPSWLHVVQVAWFQRGHMATRYGSENSYIIDGSQIPNTASLYCELGEAINGPGGYFGSGPDALVDCLRSAATAGSFELVWRNFDLSEESLGECEVDSVVSLLREFGVQLLAEANS